MKRTTRVAAFAVTVLLSAAASAQHAGRGNAKGHDDDHGNGNASMVGVDASGRLRPVTSEEADVLLAGIARYVDQSTLGLTPMFHASGAVSVDLQDRFQSVSMARLGTDGSVLLRCVGTQAEARHFLGSSPSIAAPAKPRAVPAAVLEEK